MRITDNTLSRTLLRNVSRNLKRMQRYEEQLTSGKQITRPSDNPLLVSKIMGMDTHIGQNEQYNANISESISWVKTQDTAIADATETLHRVRELAIRGASDTLSDTDRQAVKAEVEQQIEHLEDVFNTNFDGRFVFAGQKTTTKPFSINEEGILSYPDDKGFDKNVVREISTGISVELITDGNKLMQADKASDGNKELGQLLNNIVEALDDPDKYEQLTAEGGLIKDLDIHTENVVRTRTQIGAIHNRLEAAEARNKGENINLKEVLAEKEDVDMVEKFIEATLSANIYQASLSIGAKVMQPSLLDYVR